MNAVAYELAEGLSLGDWVQAGRTLRDLTWAPPWWIGDWIRYGRANYRADPYHAGVVVLGMTRERLIALASLAGLWPPEERVAGLGPDFHLEVASLQDRSAEIDLLKRALREGWTRPTLRARVRRARGLPPRVVLPSCGACGERCAVCEEEAWEAESSARKEDE